MRLSRAILIVFVALLVTGCSCRTKLAASGGEIPVPSPGDVLKDVNFAFDSYALNTPKQKDILSGNAEWLKSHPTTKVQLEGHCDERGTNEYNMKLGAHRAQAVLNYLKGLGVDMANLSTVSYGEELPLDPGHNEVAWAKNRRVHFNLDMK